MSDTWLIYHQHDPVDDLAAYALYDEYGGRRVSDRSKTISREGLEVYQVEITFPSNLLMIHTCNLGTLH